jgi:hypothetical protein
MKTTPTVIGLVALAGAVVITSPAAHADANSYLAYLAERPAVTPSHGPRASATSSAAVPALSPPPPQSALSPRPS